MDTIPRFIIDLNSALLSFIFSLIGSTIAGYLLSKGKKRKYTWLYLTIVFIAIYCLFSFLSYNLIFDSHQKYVQIIQRARDEILFIRGEYEGIDHTDPTYTHINNADRIILDNIQEKAPKLAKKLQVIPEDKLDLGYKILKNDLISYILAIAAEVEPETRIKRKYIREGLEATNRTEYLIEQVEESVENGDEYFLAIFNWIVEDNTSDRLHSIRAWYYAIQARLDGEINEQERFRVEEELNQISPAYRRRVPLSNNPSLRYFL